MTKPSSQQKQRHRARKLAMQALYQWNYNHTPVNELIPMMLEEQGETKIDRDYYEALVKGAVKDVDRIDAALQLFLDRELAELNPVELAILRVSGYEMLDKIEVPYRVVINEGVELAKNFGSQDGHKYVNAVLDKLAHQYRTTETK